MRVFEPPSVAERLRAACGGVSIRTVASRTGYHPETTRRYLQTGKISPEFALAFCDEFGVSIEWLLTGRGNTGERA
jgi:hypothetical protein